MAVGKTKLYCLTRPDKSVEKQIGHWKIISFFLMTDLGLKVGRAPFARVRPILCEYNFVGLQTTIGKFHTCHFICSR